MVYSICMRMIAWICHEFKSENSIKSLVIFMYISSNFSDKTQSLAIAVDFNNNTNGGK